MDTWTEQVRAAALNAVRIACDQHRASDRARRYFLRSALAHGVPIEQVAQAAGISPDVVRDLTDPAVAG